MCNYTLLTGSTGLLGRYLLRDLLRQNRRIAVVVRPTPRKSARQRIEQILQPWERQSGSKLSRPVCFDGDIREEFFGLDESSRQWVADNCCSAIHGAATLTFHEKSNGEPWRSNIGGTTHMLQLCRDAGIRELHYVSTAYICGLRKGRVSEDELDLGQQFRNDYEKSKTEAEKLVRAAAHIDNLTIYRPAVIAGDSMTGYTNTYHGLYMYLKLMSILVWNTEPGEDGVRYTPVRLNMTGDEPRNIVPVDWTSAVITDLFANPAAHGKTFHLAPNNPITPREIIEAGYKYFNSRGVEFSGPVPDSDQPISDMDRNAHDNMTMYRSYEDSDPIFDTTNLLRYAGHLPCPAIDEAMLHRFWKYGEEDCWGKRKPPAPKILFDVHEYIGRLAMSIDNFEAQREGGSLLSIGLDVKGAGGGQWTLAFLADRLISIAVGIADDGSETLTLASDDLAELMQLNIEARESQIRRRWGSEIGEDVVRALSAAFGHLHSVDSIALR